MQSPPPQGRGRATGGARTAPSGRGRDRRGRAGSRRAGRGGVGRACLGLGSGLAAGPRPPLPRAARRTRPARAPRRRRSSVPAGGAAAAALFPGPARARSQCEGHFRRGAAGAAADPASAGAGPAEARSRPGPQPLVAPACCAGLGGRCGRPAEPGVAAMPFLHGFRRIIFEYQPLVDAILGSLGIQDPERQEPLDG